VCEHADPCENSVLAVLVLRRKKNETADAFERWRENPPSREDAGKNPIRGYSSFNAPSKVSTIPAE